MSSRTHAHLWYERRERGWELPLCSALAMMLLLLVTVVSQSRTPQGLTGVGAILLWFVWPPLLGCILRDLSPVSLLSSFAVRQPLTNGELAGSILKLEARTSLATSTLLAPLAWMCYLLLSNEGEWRRPEASPGPGGSEIAWVVIGMSWGAALAWTYGVTSLVLRLWYGFKIIIILPGVVLSTPLVVDLSVRAGWLDTDTLQFESHQGWLPWVVSGAVIVKGLASILVWRTARRRGLVERGTEWKLMAAWVLAAGWLWGTTYLLLPAGLLPPWLLLFSVILVLPLAGLLAVPLEVARRRHG